MRSNPKPAIRRLWQSPNTRTTKPASTPTRTPTAFRAAAIFFSLLALVTSVTPNKIAQGNEIAKQAQASRDKLAADIAAVESDALRNKLEHTAANKNLAHWYAGEVKIDGQWHTLVEAAKQAATDKQLSEYRQLRSQMADRLADHEKMARWCHKKHLIELARMHWLQILRFDNTHRKALHELGLTWQSGQLLSHDQAELAKQEEKKLFRQQKNWQAKIKKLRIELEQEQDLKVQQVARQELRQIREPAALPALIEEFTKPSPSESTTASRQQELLPILAGIESSEAVNLLAQIAVEDPNPTIRDAAISQLKQKPLGEYVPVLLDNLAMPIESSVQIRSIDNLVVSSYSYAQEKPGGDEYIEDRHSYRRVPVPRYNRVRLYRQSGKYVPARKVKGKEHRVPITPGHGNGIIVTEYESNCNPYPHYRVWKGYGKDYLKTVKEPDRTIPGYTPKKYVGDDYFENPYFAQHQRATVQKSQRQANRNQAQLWERNQHITHKNQRIATALAELTGEPFTDAPKSWWTWWGEYLNQHPDVATQGTRQHLNSALLNQQQRGLSQGTWVWTRQGKLPIETLLPGDFVLAQHPRTGELAFKVVLTIKSPQPMQVTKLDIGDTELHCSPSQVVWTTGSGWKRVSNLTAGQTLHGATSEARVQQVQPTFEINTYDLVVDDFHTFFVGDQGTLVHDASPIQPNHTALPGFSPAAVAEAAKLAALVR